MTQNLKQSTLFKAEDFIRNQQKERKKKRKFQRLYRRGVVTGSAERPGQSQFGSSSVVRQVGVCKGVAASQDDSLLWLRDSPLILCVAWRQTGIL